MCMSAEGNVEPFSRYRCPCCRDQGKLSSNNLQVNPLDWYTRIHCGLGTLLLLDVDGQRVLKLLAPSTSSPSMEILCLHSMFDTKG